jgi:serine O-acetyltransferase
MKKPRKPRKPVLRTARPAADCATMPSKRVAALICEDLLQILYPGFHDDGAVRPPVCEELAARKFKGFARLLEGEVLKAATLTAGGPGGSPKIGEAAALTKTVTDRFFKSLARVRDLLRTDIEAAYEGDPAVRRREEIILAYPCIEAISIQRAAHVLYKAGAPIIPRMMTEWAHSRTGIDIHPGASIGSHFFIDHGTGVVIGETTRIGNWVKLYHGVTLGARSFAKDETGRIVKGGKRHPDVEDRVTIYPNATILGGDTVIGAGSTVGAGVFLTHSVKPDSLVIYEEKQLLIRDKSRQRKPGKRAFTI